MAFYLLLIKSITLSVRERGIDRDMGRRGEKRQKQLGIINPLIKLLFKETWIDGRTQMRNREREDQTVRENGENEW